MRKTGLRRVRSAVKTSPVKPADLPVISVKEPVDSMLALSQATASVDVKGSMTSKPAPKKSPRASAKRKPAKKPAASKKPATKKPATKKSKSPVSRKRTPTKKTTKKKSATKPKRPCNMKPTALDETGIGIGSARVKKAMTAEALNQLEHSVRTALEQAENKPVKQKLSAEDVKNGVESKEPEQGAQIPISQLPEFVKKVVADADESYTRTLREDFERQQIHGVKTGDETKGGMTAKESAKYYAAKKVAQKLARSSTAPFDVVVFNRSYNPKFYDGLDAWLDANDKHSLKLPGNTEWSRAISLVNKLCIRLSGNTRKIVATFLDHIVEQYAENALVNCLAEGRNIILLHHALTKTDGFNDRVPLDRWVQTFHQYSVSLNWIYERRNLREKVTDARKAGETISEVVYPEYPRNDSVYNFEGYVNDICRSVKKRLADQQPTEEKKLLFRKASVSQDFKEFCSSIVYEAILRIGTCLRKTVDHDDVKTISDKMVMYVLDQLHCSSGVVFDPVRNSMLERLERFSTWSEARKDLRAKNKNKTADDEDDDDEDDDVDVDVEDDEDEAEVEVDEDAEVEVNENAEVDYEDDEDEE
jgi:hypothetical protein